MQDHELCQEIAKVLWSKKAYDIEVLDVREMTVICDYMIIASGRSAMQVKALSDDVEDRMAELGATLRRSEGGSEGRWIVLDYGSILVELFHQEDRAYYNLDRLWSDGTNSVPLPFDQTEE